MTDFFAKDRNVAWDEAREEFTQIIAVWERWIADQIEFGANPEDPFCHVGAEVSGVRTVVANIRDIVDRMERS